MTLDALTPVSVHSLWSSSKFLNRFYLTILIRLRFSRLVVHLFLPHFFLPLNFLLTCLDTALCEQPASLAMNVCSASGNECLFRNVPSASGAGTLGMAPLNLCFNILFYVFLLSLFTRITSALFIYDRRTLLDIGHHCTNLLQDTLSTDPAWPLEILRSTEVNDGRLNNPRRRRKHRGRRAGIRNRLRKRAHSPPLPSILLANVRSLENKMDDLRARISFQRDIRDCNILCLTETWLTPTVPGHRCNAIW